jgi:probable poly-beta-1,6-N-acetyl-D-glucosamine export protein
MDSYQVFSELKMRYFDEINIMRACAILAVISIHVSGAYTFMDPGNFLAIVYMSVNVFSGFAVPLFICISGFVLYNKYPENIDLKKFYQKRLVSILPPYIIFSTVYLILEHLRFVDRDMPTIVYKYLTGGWNYSYWFIILIIEFYLLYPAIIRLYHYCDARGKSSHLLLIAYLVAVIYATFFVSDVLILGGTAASFLLIATKFLGYLVYFMVGIIVRSRYEDLLRTPVSRTSLCCMSVPLLCGTVIGIITCFHADFTFDITRILPVIGNYWDWLTAAIFPLYFMIIFALWFSVALHMASNKTAVSGLLERVGHNSFGIFLVHLLFLDQIVWAISRLGFGWNTWLFYPITFGLTLILSTVSVGILQKVPYGKYIIGNTR